MTRRHDWTVQETLTLMRKPFNDLLFEAQTMHRQYFQDKSIQISRLHSIKTGGCPEDCKYCPQSAHYKTSVQKSKLSSLEEVITAATAARDSGATRFCMGAAWRSPVKKSLPDVLEMIKQVKALGLETCATLGMLDDAEAQQLSDAGLDYYNHNIDTSPEYYKRITSTRTYEDRLTTLAHARSAGLKLCSGGIIGMGEKEEDRAAFLVQLACLSPHPESVPINRLIPIKGTPFGEQTQIAPLDFIRVIAAARIMMPNAYVRLSAGRDGMSDTMHALAFFAGANSIFSGDRLLTACNKKTSEDSRILQTLGLSTQQMTDECTTSCTEA